MSLLQVVTQDIRKLTDQIYRVRLAPQNGQLFRFKGGQYLFLVLPDGERVPLSIASCPEETNFIELHIRLVAMGGIVEQMLAVFNSNKPFEIEGPFGECTLRTSDRPVAIIAGGTGLSPMKSLLESAFHGASNRTFKLYLGVQKSSDLYLNDLLSDWETKQANFSYIPVVEKSDDGWQGATGYPHQVALNHLENQIADYDFYIGGSAAMVVGVFQALRKAGAQTEFIYSDILDIKRQNGEEI